MGGVVDRLEELQAEFATAVARTLAHVADLPDAEIMRLLDASGRMLPANDALLVAATVQVRERSEGLRGERMTTAHGCDRPSDLLQLVLRVDGHHAGRLLKAAGLTAQVRGITDGEFLPARYDELRRVLGEGVLGLDGFAAATAPLEAARGRVAPEVLIEADRQVAAFARGRDADAVDGGTGRSAPPPTPAELLQFSHVLAAYLDPDGAEPRDESASPGRGVWVGRMRQGRVPLRAELLPEVAAQLTRLTDSLLNPRIEPVAAPEGVHFVDSEDAICGDADAFVPMDPRTRSQKMHDAFAVILGAAARGGELPDLGGAAPTLVVTVDAADYAAGTGWAYVEGGEGEGAGVPLRVAAQIGCAGGIQRVLFDSRGRIVALGTSGRIFNALQRRAIIARDGGCVIPGCTIPATWCELHHVVEHAAGGATHTDNGVALCWHHHRTLHLSEWQIRMRGGVPEIRGPVWWDRHRDWRPVRRRPGRIRSSPAASYG